MQPILVTLLRPLSPIFPRGPTPILSLTRLRSSRARCVPRPEDEALSGMVDELLKREENRALFYGLDEASLRVDRARAALADVERQEAEARRAREYCTKLEESLSQIYESQKELREAGSMAEEAQRALSLNIDNISGEPLSEDITKNIERWESFKAALVASIVGTLASLPIYLYQTSTYPQLILQLIIILTSCALFGVTFRYTIRRDLDNVQLKTGTSAAFGFVKGLAELSANRTLEPNVSSLISLSMDGAVYVAENVFIFLFAAVALDFCFKMRLLSPFPIHKS